MKSVILVAAGLALLCNRLPANQTRKMSSCSSKPAVLAAGRRTTESGPGATRSWWDSRWDISTPVRRGHSIDYSRPAEHVLARSLDGGETWKIEKPEGLRPPPGEKVAGVPTGETGSRSRIAREGWISRIPTSS